MIYSMTGFGKTIKIFEDKQYEINIRVLNSKQIDISLKLPNNLRNIESKLRKLLTDRIGRGRIDFTLSVFSKTITSDTKYSIFDAEYLKKVMNEMKELALMMDCEPIDPLLIRSLSIPGVIRSNQDLKEEDLSEEEVHSIFQQTEEAIDMLNGFRKQEGEMLKKIILENIDFIEDYAKKTSVLAPNRINNRREKLKEELNKISSSIEYDANRLEQEIIYYIEKLDVSEELSRLTNHIQYFRETINISELPDGCGKKLGFIAQEMGREINTLGSKSNDASMQRLVVEMKDALEQVKEQIANIL